MMKFAVIPTNGRPCLEQCLDAIVPQVDYVFMIRTSPEVMPKFVYEHPGRKKMGWGYHENPEINISSWWNQGLGIAAMLAEVDKKDTWDVAILNDDVIVPEGWFAAVSNSMREFGCAAACSGGVGNYWVWREPKPVPLETRMQGFAFILAGELGLRANEDLRWYFTDDYIDWESRKLGGMVMINGYHVNHMYPNGQLTPEITDTIPQDAQTFVDIYGMRPW